MCIYIYIPHILSHQGVAPQAVVIPCDPSRVAFIYHLPVVLGVWYLWRAGFERRRTAQVEFWWGFFWVWLVSNSGLFCRKSTWESLWTLFCFWPPAFLGFHVASHSMQILRVNGVYRWSNVEGNGVSTCVNIANNSWIILDLLVTKLFFINRTIAFPPLSSS